MANAGLLCENRRGCVPPRRKTSRATAKPAGSISRSACVTSYQKSDAHRDRDRAARRRAATHQQHCALCGALLPNARILEHGGGTHFDDRELSHPGTMLLYSASPRPPLEPPRLDPPPRRLIVLDGSFRQARRMYKRSPPSAPCPSSPCPSRRSHPSASASRRTKPACPPSRRSRTPYACSKAPRSQNPCSHSTTS